MTKIRKLPNGQWQTVVSLGFRTDPRTGKRTRTQRKITRASKREVELEAARVLAEYSRGAVTNPGNMTFGEFLDYWLEATACDYKPNGVRSHRENIRAWQQTPVAGVRLERLGEPDFLRVRDAWTAAGLAPSTVGNRLGTAKVALRRAVAWGWVNRSAVEDVKRPAPRKVQYTTWSEVEANKFLSVAEDIDAIRGSACALALMTGLREGELIALRWQDVNLDAPEPYLRVERSVASCEGGKVMFGPPKTLASAAPVGLGKRAVALLRRQRARQQLRLRTVPALVFDDGYGEPIKPRHLRHGFKRACRITGLPHIRIHDLRHTAGTLARRAGVEIEEVARMLRHSDVATTYNVYSHVLPDREHLGVEALDRALGGG
jgi:integrase